jgi:two-component system sensor histidine kinase PilS (NtrC family)
MEKRIREFHILPLSRRRWLVVLRLAIPALLIGSGVLFLRPMAFNYTLLAIYGSLSVLLLAYLVSFRDLSEEAIRAALIALIAGDLIIETLLVNHVGGNFSPFIIFFIITIVTASLVFRLIGSIVVATLAGLLYSLPIFLDLSAIYEGLIEPTRLAGLGISSDEAFYTVFLHLCLFYFCAFISGYLSENLFLASRELKKIRLETDEILEQMHSGLMTVDAEGRIIYFNRAAGEILGVNHVLAKGIALGDMFHPGLNGFRERIETALAAKRSELRTEISIKHPEKGEIPLGLSLSVLADYDDRPRGIIAVFQDLSEAKKLEAHLRASDRLAAIGRLAAGIAHEIRNPLASISGSVEILKDDLSLGGDDLRLLELILKESSRLNTILTDFLNFARVTKTTAGNCDLSSVISEVAALALSHGEISRSVHISHSVHKSHIAVVGGEDQIKQILWNLILNSAQAVDPVTGKILISTDDNCGVETRSMVRLTVADNGPGIPENIREKIFEPFFSTKDEGTGLGLPIVARIVDCLEGKIELDSSPDWKTKFVVYLPVEVSENINKEKLQTVSAV